MTPALLRQTRKALKWSLQKMADATGYTKTYIHMLEKGKEPMTVNVENKVFEALKTHIDSLEKILQRIIKST